jgi:uncharacterized protein RhaS with RHS repeats
MKKKESNCHSKKFKISSHLPQKGIDTKTNWPAHRQSQYDLNWNLNLIWTYRIQLWGTASTSNIETLELFQPEGLRMTVDAPWFVLNAVIRRDLQTPTVKEEIRRYSSQYSALLSAHQIT